MSFIQRDYSERAIAEKPPVNVRKYGSGAYGRKMKATIELDKCMQCKNERLCLATDCSEAEYSSIQLCKECILEFFRKNEESSDDSEST